MRKSLIPPRMMLSKFSLIDEKSRHSHAFLDPSYLPFYYHLGKVFKAKSLLEIGFGIGLQSACYFMSNPDVENYLSLQEPEGYYSSKIGKSNIKRVYRNSFDVIGNYFHDGSFIDKLNKRKWDLVFINETRNYDVLLLWLNNIWDSLGGVICMDKVNSEEQNRRAYKDFCKNKGKEHHIIETRYGMGLINYGL